MLQQRGGPTQPQPGPRDVWGRLSRQQRGVSSKPPFIIIIIIDFLLSCVRFKKKKNTNYLRPLLSDVLALCPGVCVTQSPRMEDQKGVWRTVAPRSCPATRPTPPRTCCSGSWRVNGKAGTNPTGKQSPAECFYCFCFGVFFQSELKCHHCMLLMRSSFSSPLQHAEPQESFLCTDAHVGRWRKLWPPTEPPASPAIHPGPCHAPPAPSQHSGPAGGGLPQTGGGLHQDHQAKVHTV